VVEGAVVLAINRAATAALLTYAADARATGCRGADWDRVRSAAAARNARAAIMVGVGKWQQQASKATKASGATAILLAKHQM